MQINRSNGGILLILCLLLSASAQACKFSPQVEVVGIHEKQELELNAKPGDEFVIKCNDIIQVSGTVAKDHKLQMSNGAYFSVAGIERNEVLNKLRKLYIMLNTPNGLQIRSRKQK